MGSHQVAFAVNDASSSSKSIVHNYNKNRRIQWLGATFFMNF